MDKSKQPANVNNTAFALTLGGCAMQTIVRIIYELRKVMPGRDIVIALIGAIVFALYLVLAIGASK